MIINYLLCAAILFFHCITSASEPLFLNAGYTVPVIYVCYFILTYKWYMSFGIFQYTRFSSKLSIYKYVLNKQAYFIYCFITMVTIVFYIFSLFYKNIVNPFVIIRFYSFSILNLFVLSLLIIVVKILYGKIVSYAFYFCVLVFSQILSLIYETRDVPFIFFPCRDTVGIQPLIGYFIGVGLLFFLIFKTLKSDIVI